MILGDLNFQGPYTILSISDPANPDTTRKECTRLESCLTDIHLWMSANKLKLNSDKTEVLVVGTERKLSSFNLSNQRGWMLCTCVGQTHKQLGGQC